MVYRKVELDEYTPEPVKVFVQQAVDPQLEDVHTMLRLPRPQIGLAAGCNFAAAHVLLNVISGVSTTLFEQDGPPGNIFKSLLTHSYWPGDPPEGLSPDEASATLYDEFRNSLIHTLGLRVTLNRKTNVRTVRRTDHRLEINRVGALDDAQIAALEVPRARPSSIGPTLKRGTEKTVLLVEGFYWGTREMISRLSQDSQRMARAQLFLKPVLP